MAGFDWFAMVSQRSWSWQQDIAFSALFARRPLGIAVEGIDKHYSISRECLRHRKARETYKFVLRAKFTNHLAPYLATALDHRYVLRAFPRYSTSYPSSSTCSGCARCSHGIRSGPPRLIEAHSAPSKRDGKVYVH